MPPAPTKSHASRVNFASLTLNNLGTVRKLNSVLFPIKYSEKFYQDILLPEAEDFCKLVYYNDVPVGTICCRLEVKDGQTELYLMTMGILAPYRHLGIGGKSLELILESAASHTKPKISRIYLHVQVSNDGAKQFYQRHGFEEIGVAEHYYKKIVPSDAWILQRTFAA
ncbi:acyl-CoA N-acyltransferase [Dentipellis sp. KUC8613]|nr:acyl-CoA N-acyltransferase [Dentipellis sp. KUC8613]